MHQCFYLDRLVRLCFLISCFLCLLQRSLFAQHPDNAAPCFAGTLLAEYATNIPPCVFLIQPYGFFNRQIGMYDSNSSLIRDRNDHLHHFLLALETGITEKIDVSLYLNSAYATSDDDKSFDYGDTVILFGFQMARDKRATWIPDLRFMVGESFPTGKFEKTGTRTRSVNSIGSGAYETLFIFITRKIFYNWPNHPYNWNLNLYYILFSNVDVKGVSVYGGGPDTMGKVKPGEEFIVNLAFEYKFNYNWGGGIDFNYHHKNSSSFHQKNDSSTPAGLPSSENLSLAPDLEYCFNDNLSVTAGWWFSVAGRNSIAFRSVAATIYYTF